MLDEKVTRTVSSDGANVQLLKEMDHTITVRARGSSLEDLAGKLFQIMRKQIFQEIDKPIIQMEAKEVYFDQVETEETTEHFMLIFWPRTKTTYEATARIVVTVKYLDINERK